MNFLSGQSEVSTLAAKVALGDTARLDLLVHVTAAQPDEFGIRPEHPHLVAG